MRKNHLIKRRELRRALLFVAILSLSIISLWVLAYRLSPPEVESADHGLELHLFIDGGEWTVNYETVTEENNTVFLLLLEAARVLTFSVEWTYWEGYSGIKIDSINGYEDGDGGFYWQYWVNGQLGEVAADKKELKDFDRVEWIFEPIGYNRG